MTTGRVLVALSGGIDSAATVLLLQDRGFEVESVTFDMLGNTDFMASAEALAQKLGIRHHALDVRKEFNAEVVDYFVKEYVSGHTPAPCSICNPLIKWRFLEKLADQLGIEHIATGHYCRVANHRGHYYVAQGVDPKKDQSYYLWGLTQSQLRRAVTPMGEHTKESIRDFMQRMGYEYLVHQRESMSICFLRGVDYASFVAEHAAEGSILAGEVLDRDGRVVGSHRGLALYTVGQKRDLDLSVGGDWRVVVIDSRHNRLVVGSKEDLYVDRLMVENVNVVDRDELLNNEVRIMVRGFGLNPAGMAQVSQLSDDLLEVRVPSRAWAVAAGQPVVFYLGERVLGGGVATVEEHR